MNYEFTLRSGNTTLAGLNCSQMLELIDVCVRALMMAQHGHHGEAVASFSDIDCKVETT